MNVGHTDSGWVGARQSFSASCGRVVSVVDRYLDSAGPLADWLSAGRLAHLGQLVPAGSRPSAMAPTASVEEFTLYYHYGMPRSATIGFGRDVADLIGPRR